MAIQQSQRRCRDVRECPRAVTVESGKACIQGSRYGRRFNSAARNAAFLGVVFTRGQARRCPEPAQDFHDPATRIVDQDGYFAAEAEGVAVGHAQGQNRGRGRVRRIAAALENGDTGIDRFLAAGRHGSLAPGALPATRLLRR